MAKCVGQGQLHLLISEKKQGGHSAPGKQALRLGLSAIGLDALCKCKNNHFCYVFFYFFITILRLYSDLCKV